MLRKSQTGVVMAAPRANPNNVDRIPCNSIHDVVAPSSSVSDLKAVTHTRGNLGFLLYTSFAAHFYKKNRTLQIGEAEHDEFNPQVE
jgi:hypothetical protein